MAGVRRNSLQERQIIEHLPRLLRRSSTFTSPTASMTIRVRSTQAYTEGDVIREVDSLALTGDWLLVRAGYLGNLNLEQNVADFKAKRKRDPGLLMDCIVAPRSRKYEG